MVIRREVEFAITYLAMTLTRSRNATFSTVVVVDQNRLYMKRPIPTFGLSSLLGMFEAAFVAVYIAACFVCFLIIWLCHLRPDLKWRWGHGLWVVLMAMWEFDLALPIKAMASVSTRAIIFTLCVYGSLTIRLWSAEYTSAVTYQREKAPIDSLEDFLKYVHFLCCDIKGITCLHLVD